MGLFGKMFQQKNKATEKETEEITFSNGMSINIERKEYLDTRIDIVVAAYDTYRKASDSKEYDRVDGRLIPSESNIEKQKAWSDYRNKCDNLLYTAISGIAHCAEDRDRYVDSMYILYALEGKNLIYLGDEGRYAYGDRLENIIYFWFGKFNEKEDLSWFK